MSWTYTELLSWIQWLCQLDYVTLKDLHFPLIPTSNLQVTSNLQHCWFSPVIRCLCCHCFSLVSSNLHHHWSCPAPSVCCCNWLQSALSQLCSQLHLCPSGHWFYPASYLHQFCLPPSSPLSHPLPHPSITSCLASSSITYTVMFHLARSWVSLVFLSSLPTSVSFIEKFDAQVQYFCGVWFEVMSQ